MIVLHGLRMDATPWDEVTGTLSLGHRRVAQTLPLGAHRRAMTVGADLSLGGIAKLVAEFRPTAPSRRHPACWHRQAAAGPGSPEGAVPYHQGLPVCGSAPAPRRRRMSPLC